MIEAVELKRMLVDGLRDRSPIGYRGYLGMSEISQCQRKLFLMMTGQGEPGGDQQHWYTWLGWMHQEHMMRLLPGGIEYSPREFVAPYDSRFRGHNDFEMGDTLIEFKSVNYDKFCRIIRSGVALDHEMQVQMYMRHGNWLRAFVVYEARDVPHNQWHSIPIYVVEVLPNISLADTCDAKAKTILTAVDAGGPPPLCDCGWCQE